MGMATESQFHVLAVDDSLIDRKLIEKLLKTSYFQGMLIKTLNYLFVDFMGFWLSIFLWIFWQLLL